MQKPYDKKSYEILASMISDAFEASFGRKPNQERTNKNMMNEVATPVQTTTSPAYKSIEDYTAKTGKRFRMTKDQKTRNISREQAFEEFLNEMSKGN
jgi:hypothetical protein